MASDRLGADLIVVPIGARGYAEEFLLESKVKSFYMDKTLVERVKEIEGIESITSQTYLASIAGVCCDVSASTVVAFNQETDFIVGPWLEKSIGRKLQKGEAIIGYESYLNLGLDLLEFDTTLFHNRFRVVGTLEKSGTGLDNAIFINDENIDDIIRAGTSGLKPGQISIIFTKVKKGYDPYMVGREIEGEIVEVDVVARSDMGKDLISTLEDISRIFLITIILTSMLSIFLAWAIFSAMANERAREVGIMRVIGAKESHIVRLFVTEILIMGVMGSLAGIGLGTYLSVSLSKNFKLLKDIPIMFTVVERITIDLAAFGIGIGICIIGALLPVFRVKKMEPLVAIRIE